MNQFFSFYIEIYCADDEINHEIFRSDVFDEVKELFLKLAELDLAVSICYDTWWDNKKE